MGTDAGKITTRLRPDVDRRLRAAAALRRARLSQMVNEALDESLPSLPEIGAMVAGLHGWPAGPAARAGHRTAGGDRGGAEALPGGAGEETESEHA